MRRQVIPFHRTGVRLESLTYDRIFGMDALYFFRHSDHNDLELRYSLRSIAKHMPWIRKVWIFGDRPQFLVDDQHLIEHIPHEYMARVGDYRTPLTNFFLMFHMASLIPGLASEYLWFCDDFICIDDVSPELARRDRYVENMADVKERGTGLWMESLWKTYDFLKRLGYPGYNFEVHAPTFYTKKRVFEAWCDFQDYVTEDRWFGMLGPTAILNHTCLQDESKLVNRQEEGLWVGFHERETGHTEVRNLCRGKTFLNFDDAGFSSGVAHYLQDKFPIASPFERDDVTETDLKLTNHRPASLTLPESVPDDVNVHVYPKVILKNRHELSALLNERQLTTEGVQVGVMQGNFSEHLLRHWRGKRLHCVDSWLDSQADPRHIDKYNLPQWKIDHNYNETVRRLASFADRCHIHRMRPVDAATLFPDSSLAFVYITEQHYREAVWEQLETWSRKVQPGGILGGHNYLDGVLPSGHFEVKSTVDTWAHAKGLKVECTGESVWRSWLITME
ncbi:MAG: hypothetical protein ACI8P0_005404 [Planctomycetaceae bacterium]|jgi:hypothetical protein